MLQKVAAAAGWMTLGFVICATLSPIGMRPVSPLGTQQEHLIAFGVITLLFSIGYPRHRWLVVISVIIVAGLLEAGQLLQPTRDGRLADLIVKIVGAALGSAASLLVSTRLEDEADEDPFFLAAKLLVGTILLVAVAVACIGVWTILRL